MSFDLKQAIPPLIRRSVEYSEEHFPAVPEAIPDVVAADPGWARQWTNTKLSIEQGALKEARRPADPKRRKDAAQYLAMMGHLEFDLIVRGCSFAADKYEMPIAWRMCILQQAHDDMTHAAGFITSASRMVEEDLWKGVHVPYYKTIKSYRPILERDLGGFFAAVGLHTEAYLAWTNLSGGGAITDPVVGAWSLSEIEDEAWHLTFLFPAMKTYLHTGTPEEQDRRKKQLIEDNEIMLESVVQPAYKNAKDFAVGRLGMDPKVLYGYEHLDTRTRYILRSIGIEESYWPAYLKGGQAKAETGAYSYQSTPRLELPAG